MRSHTSLLARTLLGLSAALGTGWEGFEGAVAEASLPRWQRSADGVQPRLSALSWGLPWALCL